MDGLLFDSETIYRDSFFRTLSQYGLDHDAAQFESLIGLGWTETDARLAEWYPDLNTTAFADAWRAECQPATDRMPALKNGANRLLDLLDDNSVPAAIATGSSKNVAEAYLEHHGLANRFAALVTGEDCSFGKPHPEPFLAAAVRLGVTASRCVVLEDSVNGIRAGHAAGALPIFVPDLLGPTPEVHTIAHCVAECLDAVADLCADALARSE